MSPRKILVVVESLRCASAFRWASCATLSLILGCGSAVPQASTADRPQPGDSSSDGGDAAVTECASNSDCDDNVFCNGPERCAGGVCHVSGYPCGDDLCNEAQNRCVQASQPEPEPEPNFDPAPTPIIDESPTSVDDVLASCNSGVLAASDEDVVAIIAVAELDDYSGLSFDESIGLSIDACIQDWGAATAETESCIACWTTATNYAYQRDVAPPAPLPAPVIPTASVLVAADGTFLGNVNDYTFDSDSIANSFGTYGSTFNSLSIWNEFGTYGSEFNSLSPWNAFTSTPPCIVENGACVVFVTANTILQPAIHPNDLAILVERTDVLR